MIRGKWDVDIGWYTGKMIQENSAGVASLIKIQERAFEIKSFANAHQRLLEWGDIVISFLLKVYRRMLVMSFPWGDFGVICTQKFAIVPCNN